MKQFIKNLIFRGYETKEYFGVRIADNEIKERTVLRSGQETLDVTESYCIVCQSPHQILIWADKSNEYFFANEVSRLEILEHNTLKASLKLSLKQILEENGIVLVLLEAETAQLYQLNIIRQYLISLYLNRQKRHSFRETKVNAALFSYPRKVVITSFRDSDYYNMFPMDFQGYVAWNNTYILGLRNTNKTLGRMIEKGQVVVSATGNAGLNDIYFLGKNHSGNIPPIKNLPFSTTDSELFRFPIPEFSDSYKEIEILKTIVIGSHTLIVGSVVNSKTIRKSETDIYHIHLFQFMKSEYPKA